MSTRVQKENKDQLKREKRLIKMKMKDHPKK